MTEPSKRAAPRPIYAVPVRSSMNAWVVVLALAAGLTAGGFLFYRIYESTYKTSHEISRPPPQTDSARVTASSSEPARQRHTSGWTRTTQTTVKTSRAKKTRTDHASEDFTPPELISPAPNITVAQTSTPVSPHPQPAPLAASSSNRRPAVQDPGTAYAPMPLPGPPDASASNNSSPVPTPATAPTSQSADESASPAVKVNYAGPSAGLINWTGKLDKDETLTITGAKASLGSLSGPGLPGVPVRITVDQSNLGFLEMPSSANGYRRLVIRSHSKHEKITIHWTVTSE